MRIAGIVGVQLDEQRVRWSVRIQLVSNANLVGREVVLLVITEVSKEEERRKYGGYTAITRARSLARMTTTPSTVGRRSSRESRPAAADKVARNGELNRRIRNNISPPKAAANSSSPGERHQDESREVELSSAKCADDPDQRQYEPL